MSHDVRLHLGDCLDVLRGLPASSVDALVTDPPAGIGFMGRAWDTFGRSNPAAQEDRKAAYDRYGKGALPYGFSGASRTSGDRERFIAFLTAVAEECLRVMKPGAHGLVWALPRTSHWTATALEDAGFEVRDSITHHFGSGFPKSLDVSKAIDKAADAEREVVGSRRVSRELPNDVPFGQGLISDRPVHGIDIDVTAPATEAAKTWQGWGTALKPAAEVWWLVRKPLDSPNVASNVLKHGTGALNVDGCRVTGVWSTWRRSDGSISAKEGRSSPLPMNRAGGKTEEAGRNPEHPSGRWPANLVLSHSEGCRPVGVRKVRSDGHRPAKSSVRSIYGKGLDNELGAESYLADPDGTEIVAAWECAEDCPVAELDRQSGVLTSGFMAAGTEREGLGYRGGLGTRVTNDTWGDSGGASRFFPTFRYEPKASTAERNQGLPEAYLNRHPTVKPVDLMRWLCRLVTPPDGLVLDPFMGSGSTGVAAKLEGFRFIGIEKDAESYETACRRLEWAVHEPGLFE